MRKYAVLNNNCITEILDLDDASYELKSRCNQLLVDVEDMSVAPQVGWILQGNSLVPYSDVLPLLKLQIAAKLKFARQFGDELRGEMTDRIGAVNVLKGKSEADVVVMVTQLMPIANLLSGGALKTARTALIAIRPSFVGYETEIDYAINKITNFLGS